ncbi:MAG: 7-cyano-7-deazaguanine synthase QueC [Planctomycetes bacterium]|nr:7-cyano-7-deazaguanine synthase QueC [Planctomycetota bacterium]
MNGIAICSGGLDSTVSLSLALHNKIKIKLILFFDYGQKALKNELSSITKISRYYAIKLKILKLPFLKEITKTALVNKNHIIPKLSSSGELNNAAITKKTAEMVWVPNRNGLFVNIAACFCDTMKIHSIITGFDKEEAKTFPDNSKLFINKINNALFLSTQQHPKVISFTINMNKNQIVHTGRKLNSPLHLTWSCYTSNKKPCLECESCARAQRAFRHNDIIYNGLIN